MKVHVVVPAGIDDPRRPSGGNVYDRRICHGLATLGWDVMEHEAPGAWPCPDVASRSALARVLDGIEDGVVVLIDGLVASAVPEVLVPEADRLRLVILVHMILGGPNEAAVLAAASRVVTTSGWTRDQLVLHYGLAPESVGVAEPGVEPAGLDPGSPGGVELVCVGAVTAHKGHDTLITALISLADLPWRCVCVGSRDREPAFVTGLLRRVGAAGLSDRVSFTGPLVGVDLDRAYAAADVSVLASRAETYGMVVTEALAHGLPVIATSVGGLPEALGQTSAGVRTGLLVPPDDPAALAAALRDWLTDADLRSRLRHAARERRRTLSGWDVTTHRLASILTFPELVGGPMSQSVQESRR